MKMLLIVMFTTITTVCYCQNPWHLGDRLSVALDAITKDRANTKINHKLVMGTYLIIWRMESEAATAMLTFDSSDHANKYYFTPDNKQAAEKHLSLIAQAYKNLQAGTWKCNDYKLPIYINFEVEAPSKYQFTFHY